MDEPRCEGCRRLLERLGALEAEVADLRARLGRNSSNSSSPPSADPPSAPAPVVKKPTGRKPGGQPGHAAHLRRRLPPERVTRVIKYIPDRCGRCRADLPAAAGPDDPEPTWHQVAELPAVAAEIVEHQGHFRTCVGCGAVSHAAVPAEVRAHATGPGLTAALSYFVGRCHLSRRLTEEAVEVLFDVSMALGTVSRLEQEVRVALAPAHAEVAAAVRAAPAKNVDETSWKRRGRLCWLWAAVTDTAALFVVYAGRGAAGLTALLGETIVGVLTSDRWAVYGRLPPSRRQLCWAHLIRDFQAMVDRAGAGAAIGRDLLLHADVLFGKWYKVRDGTRKRPWLIREVEWIRVEVVDLLRRGRVCACAKTAATCREMLAVEEAMWTFASVEGVEPTNNAAERAVRPAVLWRKRSFGCWSEDGCRYVERLLTVTHTLRLQGRNVLDYLKQTLVAHRARLPAPRLLLEG
jgi:transposase